jgi:hypothetical protein
MINDILDLFTIELMKDGYCYSAVSECGQEGYSPVGGVTTAECDLVALLDIAVLKKNM